MSNEAKRKPYMTESLKIERTLADGTVGMRGVGEVISISISVGVVDAGGGAGARIRCNTSMHRALNREGT